MLLARITPSFENGKAGVVRDLPNGIGAGSTEFFVFRPINGALIPEYLLAHFKTPQFLRDGEQLMSGAVGQQRVPKQYVLDSELPLPPPNEQQRIVDKLDDVLARVDTCRERLDRVSRILNQFRRAVLAAATSGKLTEAWREKSRGQTEYHTINFDEDCISVPNSWDVFALKELIDPARPLCYGVVQPGREVDGGIPLIRVQDMSQGGVLIGQLRTVTQETDAEYRRSRIKPGDLLVSVVGTIGRTAIVPADLEANIARAVARIACREGIRSNWVNIWLSSDTLQWWLTKSAREVARKTLNLSELGVTQVAVPPVEEQDEIIRRVENLFAFANRLELRYTSANAQVERLTPALLAKAFRGELVPQDPNDEPVASLLERIRTARPEERTGRRHRPRRSSTPPRAPRERANMTKSRHDDDVKDKPYLAGLLREVGGTESVEELFRRSDLPVIDFFKQLAWEVKERHIRDDHTTLEAA